MARNSPPFVPYVPASASDSEYYGAPTTYQQSLPYDHLAMGGLHYTPSSESSFFIPSLAQLMPPNPLDTHISDLQPYGVSHGQYNTDFDYFGAAPSLRRAGSSVQLNPEASEFEPRFMNFLDSPSGDLDVSTDKAKGPRDSPNNELAESFESHISVMSSQLGFAASSYATHSTSQSSDLARQSPISLNGSDLARGADIEHDHRIYPSIESDTGNDYASVYQFNDSLTPITYTQTVPMQPVLHLPSSHAQPDFFGAIGLREDVDADDVHNIAVEHDGEDDRTPSGTGEDSMTPSAHVVQSEEALPQITPWTTDQETTTKLKEGLAIFKTQKGDQLALGSKTAFWTAPAQDETIPTSQLSKDSCHQKLVAAILNNVGCIENEHTRSFQNRWADGAKFYTQREIDAIALEILDMTISIHQIGWTKPIFDTHMREEIFKTCLFKFDERFDALISLLTISKNTCEALLKCERLHAVVGNPWMLDRRVRSNKASNGRKASRIAFATAAEKQERAAQLDQIPKDNKEKAKTRCTKRTREDDDDEGELGTAQVTERPTKRPLHSTRTKLQVRCKV